MKKLTITLLALLISAPLFALVGCQTNSNAGQPIRPQATESSPTTSTQNDTESGSNNAPGSGAHDPPISTARRDTGVNEALAQQVISSAEARIESSKLAAARDRVIALIAQQDGLVADENTTSTDAGKITYTNMRLRVPSKSFDATLKELRKVGTLKSIVRKSEDVTAQVVDVAARVRAQEAGVRRVETLLARAKDLGEVIRIETELTRRQSDLDSLKQQQKSLAAQTSMSTITLSLSRPYTPSTPVKADTGFWAGMTSGWDALKGCGTGIGHGVGAVIPWLPVMAIVLLPLWWLGRKLTRRLIQGTKPKNHGDGPTPPDAQQAQPA